MRRRGSLLLFLCIFVCSVFMKIIRFSFLMAQGELDLFSISGSPLDCGRAYGEEFRLGIYGLYMKELKATKKKLKFATDCFRYMEYHTPTAARFVRGMSEGASLRLEEAVLLSLHEEVYHMNKSKDGHCTAIIAANDMTPNGVGTLVGQNWDWDVTMYPLPGILKTEIDGGPGVLSYHFPGMPFCCGVNTEGLGFMWTSSGSLPLVKPEIGVPTYALINEILRKDSVEAVVDYIKGVKTAGSFIFFFGDPKGDTAVIELIPGNLSVERGSDLSYRANLFTDKKIVELSKQDPPDLTKIHSVVRMKRLNDLTKNLKGKIDVSMMQSLLSSEGVFINDHMGTITLDRLVADCNARELHVSRGGSPDNKWKKYGF